MKVKELDMTCILAIVLICPGKMGLLFAWQEPQNPLRVVPAKVLGIYDFWKCVKIQIHYVMCQLLDHFFSELYSTQPHLVSHTEVCTKKSWTARKPQL